MRALPRAEGRSESFYFSGGWGTRRGIIIIITVTRYNNAYTSECIAGQRNLVNWNSLENCGGNSFRGLGPRQLETQEARQRISSDPCFLRFCFQVAAVAASAAAADAAAATAAATAWLALCWTVVSEIMMIVFHR